MGRLLTPKNKLARREGVDLGLKTYGSKSQAALLRRINVTPGLKAVRKKFSKSSDYGRQLREKQKLKRIYNINENQMRRYFDKAVKKKGNTADYLIQNLESRLDNAVYRLRFTPTRNAARQLISHGHIKVNGRKVDIPSYLLKKGDVIEFRKKKTSEIPYIKEIIEEKNYQLPKWLKRTKTQGVVTSSLNVEEYAEPVDLALVIEFYSKL